MSSKSLRKSHSASTEEKEKKQAESPVKDMKKKVAAIAEKEKSTDKTIKSPERSEKNTEKHDKVEKTPNDKGDSKKADKNAPVPEKNAQADKAAKNVDKTNKSAEKSDKSPEKNDKTAEKIDKNAEIKKVNDKKSDKPAEKKNEPEKEAVKVDTNGKDAPEKPKSVTTNGNSNGTDTVSDEASSDEEELLIIDSQDEIFPELTYDESDVEVDDAPSRSFTRRSQVKATKTPETPRPASFKDDDSKEKVLKMTDSLATDRKLRSSDSPKPETKKTDKKESSKDTTIDLTEEKEEGKEGTQEKEGDKEKEAQKEASKNKLELDAVVEMETLEGESRPRTRARVSPYSRPKLDQTTTSLVANYTGNNTTMEMDITETSSILEEPSLDSSAYLRGLRDIRGRSSYKQLKELNLSHVSRTPRNTSTNSSVLSEGRPIHSVQGRKRKPSEEASAAPLTESSLHAHSKRMRLLDHFPVPFRGFNTRRAAEMCGINSDLPLTAPVAAGPAAPEPLKAGPAPRGPPMPRGPADHDPKRSCIVM